MTTNPLITKTSIAPSDYMGAQETLRLKRAILLYETAISNEALATVHAVNCREGAPPEIQAGFCLTQDALDELLRAMAGMSPRRTLLPDGMLSYDGGRMAWWTAPKRRPIFFKTSDKQFNAEVSGKVVLHPPLLFVAEPRNLYVFALAEAARPKADTKFCRAPYFNIYGRGNMCAGNVPLPEIIQPEDVPTWEKAFFETNFTHSNVGGGHLTKKPMTHEMFWRMLRPSPPGTTGSDPAEWSEFLCPLDLTVDQIINIGESQ